MFHMSHIRASLMALTLVLVLAGPVAANPIQIQEDVAFALPHTSCQCGGNSWVPGLDYLGFDTQLGTLLEASWVLKSTMSGSITTFSLPYDQTFGLALEGITGDLVGAYDSFNPLTNHHFERAAQNFQLVPGGSPAGTISLVEVFNETVAVDVPNNLIGAFKVVLPANYFNPFGDAGTGLEFGFGELGDILTADWSGTLSVLYTYEPTAPPFAEVAEPATFLLLGAGLTLARLRRQRVIRFKF